MGMTEMIIIGAIALILIGPKKMPDLARAIGRALTEFRKASNEFKSSITREMDDITGSPDIKDLSSMANQLKQKNIPKNIEDYLEKAADVLEDAGKEIERRDEAVKEEGEKSKPEPT